MSRIIPMASSIRPLSSFRFSSSSRFGVSFTSYSPAHRFSLHHLGSVVPQSHIFGVRCLKGEEPRVYSGGPSFSNLEVLKQLCNSKRQYWTVAKTVDLIKVKGGKVTREPGPVKGGSTVIAFIEDPDGYKFQLLERGPTLEPLCQVMLRVGDLNRSINFYEKAFGMELLRKRDNPEYKYTIAIMGYGPEDKSAVLELTYNYGITEYDKGNAYAQYTIAIMGYGPEDKSDVLELTYNYGITEYDKGNAYAQTLEYLVSRTQLIVKLKNQNSCTALDIIEQMPRDLKTAKMHKLLVNYIALNTETTQLAQGEVDLIEEEHWLEKKRDAILVAATVIAGMTYQAGLNPPGGVWDEDGQPYWRGKNITVYSATSIWGTRSLDTYVGI